MHMADIMIADQTKTPQPESDPTTPTKENPPPLPAEAEEDVLSIGNGESAKERRELLKEESWYESEDA